MKLRSFLTLLAVGVLTLSLVFCYANMKIIEKEYRHYRDGVFARAYESLLSELIAYRRSEDGSLSARIASRLAELPLSSGETDLARRYIADMAAGAYEAESKKRALSYTNELLTHLSVNRSHAYGAGWRATGMGLPAYPESSIPTVSRPQEEPSPAEQRREKASVLLGGKNTVSYQREENGVVLFGFRTASSFVEFTEEGRLRRLLLPRRSEVPPPPQGEAAAMAASFLAQWAGKDAAMGDPETVDNALLFPFALGEEAGTVGVAAEGVFLFRI